MGKSVPQESVKGYALGLNRGYIVEKRSKRAKPSHRRKTSSRTTLIRKVIRSVCGLSTYEKRALELYKIEDSKLDKRATKFLKRRLGGWKRANRKKDQIRAVLKNRKDKKADF
jgi:hypothetical protein